MTENNLAYPVYNVGPDELGEYDIKDFPSDCDWLVYYYESGCYDGSGMAVWHNKDGTLGWETLSHCSCYGPTEDLDQEKRYKQESVLADLETKPEDYDYKEKLAVREKVLELLQKEIIKMRFYLSHPIRGSKGDKATAEDMRKNNEKAIEVAKYIRNAITPEIEVYVPAEHEDFVGRAYRFKYLTVDQILTIDCSIIDTCDAVLIYSPDDSVVAGCKVEYEHAVKNGISVCIFKDEVDAVTWVAEFILRV